MTELTPRDVAKKIMAQIDLTATDSVELECAPGKSDILQHQQRERIADNLDLHFSSDDRRSFMTLSKDWKESSYSDSGQTFELIYSSTFEIDCPTRNDALSGRHPQGEEPQIAKTYRLLSKALLRDQYGSQTISYRGIKTYDGLVQAVVDAWGTADPELKLTKLSNFTLDRKTADFHGTLSIQAQIQPSDIALAADFFIPYLTNNGEIEKNEAELRLFGDRVNTIDEGGVILPGSDKTITEAVVQSHANSYDEHDIVAGVIYKLSERDIQVPKQITDEVIQWYYDYFEIAPKEALSLKSDIETVTGKSLDL